MKSARHVAYESVKVILLKDLSRTYC